MWPLGFWEDGGGNPASFTAGSGSSSASKPSMKQAGKIFADAGIFIGAEVATGRSGGGGLGRIEGGLGEKEEEGGGGTGGLGAMLLTSFVPLL